MSRYRWRVRMAGEVSGQVIFLKTTSPEANVYTRRLAAAQPFTDPIRATTTAARLTRRSGIEHTVHQPARRWPA